MIHVPEEDLPLVGVFAGPTATILNTPPIGADPDALVPQRLATDILVQVQDGSAHPMAPSAPADSHTSVALRQGQLVALPMPAGAGPAEQSFFPSAERLYAEVDALCVDDLGQTRPLSRLASFQHFRAGPPAGHEPLEARGVDFFPYGSWDQRAEPDTAALMKITNAVQDGMEAADIQGAQWLEGSPVIEETLYWLGLLIDTDKPIVGQVAQRMHRSVGSDGPQNLIDGVRYICSRVWDLHGAGDEVGPVLVADGVVRSARGVFKVAGRPGGYEGGGPVATCTTQWPIRLEYLPLRRHTRTSLLRISDMPASVTAVDATAGTRSVRVMDSRGRLDPEVLPAVDIVVYGRYGGAGCGREDLGVADSVAHNIAHHGLAGFILEGIAPNGWATRAVEASLATAVFSGFPVVWCGRGRPQDPVGRTPLPFVAGSNLSATKARMLLMACLLRYGASPVAQNPGEPTPAEKDATAEYIQTIQHVFDTH
jgi:L-asparaginase